VQAKIHPGAKARALAAGAGGVGAEPRRQGGTEGHSDDRWQLTDGSWELAGPQMVKGARRRDGRE